ncbi:MAG: hypothetical protein AAGI48_05290 [Verrucomicrobiota bacterium]
MKRPLWISLFNNRWIILDELPKFIAACFFVIALVPRAHPTNEFAPFEGPINFKGEANGHEFESDLFSALKVDEGYRVVCKKKEVEFQFEAEGMIVGDIAINCESGVVAVSLRAANWKSRSRSLLLIKGLVEVTRTGPFEKLVWAP